jgi:hypothetical protein
LNVIIPGRRVKFKQAWEKKEIPSRKRGHFLHVEFGEQEGGWVLRRAPSMLAMEKIACWAKFHARKKVVCL